MRELSAFDDDVEKMMRSGHQEALRLGHHQLEVDHLLLGIIAVPESAGATMLRRLGCDLSILKHEVEHAFQPSDPAAPQTPPMILTKETERVLVGMHTEADKTGSEQIGTEHVLLCILSDQGHIARMLGQACGITSEHVQAAL